MRYIKYLAIAILVSLSFLNRAEAQCSVVIDADNSTICEGDQVILTSVITGADCATHTVQWSSGAVSDVIFVNPTVLDHTYSITLYDAASVEIGNDNIDITVNSLGDPTIVFCDGIVSPVSPGGTFAFNPDVFDGSTIDANTGVIAGGVVGSSYSVQYTTSTGCSSSTETSVYVDAPVYVDAAAVVKECSFDLSTYTVSFDISDGDPNTYSVDFPGTFSGITYTSDPINIDDNYNINISDASSCAPFNINGSHSCDCSLVGEISGDVDICPSVDGAINVSFQGGVERTFVFAIDGFSQPAITTSDNPYIINTSQVGVYTLVSVEDANCSVTGSGTATVTEIDVPTISGVVEACSLDELTYIVTFDINGGDPASYTVAGPGSLTGPVFESDPINSGDFYSFDVTDGSNCTAANINSNHTCQCAAQASISGDITICPGSEGLLDITLIGQAPWDIVYSINGVDQDPIQINSNPFQLPVTGAGNYELVSVSDLNCEGSGFGVASVSYIGNEDPSFTLLTFCTGIVDVETPDGVFSFAPDLGDGSSIDENTGSISNGIIGTEYTILYTTPNTCFSSTQSAVFVANPIEVNSFIEDCSLDQTTYTVTIDIDKGDPSTYSVGGLGTLDGDLFTSDPIVSGADYSFEISDNTGCPTVVISGSQECTCPSAATISGDVTICPSSEGMLNIDFEGQAPWEFVFSINGVDQDPITTSDASYELPVSEEGDYAMVTVSDANCDGSSSGFAHVGFSDIEDSSFTLADFCAGTDNQATDIATSGGAFSFDIMPSDDSSIDPSDATISNPTAGSTYSVKYSTSGACGSSTVMSVSVFPAITISPISSIESVCPGSTFDLGVSVSGEEPFSNSIWQSTSSDVSFNSGDENGANFTAGSSAGSSTIIYSVTDNNNCIGSAAMPIEVNAAVVAGEITGNLEACNGTEFNLTVSPSGGAPPYSLVSWVSSDEGKVSLVSEDVLSAVFAANDLGSATIEYTVQDSEGCQGSSTAILTVNSGPVAENISGTSDFCIGGSLDLSIDVNGGSGGYTYYWESNNANVSVSGGASITASAISSGNAVISCHVVDGNGCESNSSITEVVVHDQPVIALGQIEGVCFDNAIDVTIQDLDTEYQFLGFTGLGWTVNGNNTIPIFTGPATFTFAAATSTSDITYELNAITLTPEALGCVANNTASITIHPQDTPLPIIIAQSGDQICPGQQSVFISQNNREGSYFEWSIGGSSDNVLSTEEVGQMLIVNWSDQPSGTNTIQVIESVNNDCNGSDMLNVSFSSGTAPEPADIFYSPVNNILVYNDSDPDCYQWGFINDADEFEELPGQVFQSYVADVLYDPDLTYWCKAWNGDCSSPASCSSIAISRREMSIIDVEKPEGFKLYPNPNHGAFNILMDNAFPGSEYRLVIANTFGQVMKDELVLNSGKQLNYTVDDGSLVSGMYFFTIYRNGEIVNTAAFVVQNDK